MRKRSERGGWEPVVWGMGGVLCAAVLFGCTGFGGRTPAQAFRDATQAFKSARAVHMEGQVTQGSTNYALTLSQDGQDVDGAVVVNDMTISVRSTGGRTFFNGAEYFQSSLGLVTLSRWVLASQDNLSLLVEKLTNRSDLAGALMAGAGADVQRHDGPTIDGKGTSELVGTGVTVFVGTGATQQPLRFQTAAGQELSDKLQNLKLDISYG